MFVAMNNFKVAEGKGPEFEHRASNFEFPCSHLAR